MGLHNAALACSTALPSPFSPNTHYPSFKTPLSLTAPWPSVLPPCTEQYSCTECHSPTQRPAGTDQEPLNRQLAVGGGFPTKPALHVAEHWEPAMVEGHMNCALPDVGVGLPLQVTVQQQQQQQKHK